MQSRIKQLEKVELIEVEEDDAVMDFHFPTPPAGGHSVVKLEKVSKNYGPISILDNFDFEIVKGDRIAIVGVNGEEKTPEEMEAILAQRRANWKPKAPKYTKGLLKLYSQHAVSPMKGAYME